MPITKIDETNQSNSMAPTFVSAIAPMDVTDKLTKEENRQNIPTKKQLVDPFRQGLIIEGGVGYRQTLVIRSYEVGADKTMTLETILNLLQVVISTCESVITSISI